MTRRRLTFALAAVVALGTVARAAGSDDPLPPIALDPEIATMVAAVSPDRLREIDTRLVAFGTRSAFSETLHDRKRGVYAARDWIAGHFHALARAAGGDRLRVTLDTYDQPKTAQAPRAVEISSVFATLRGDDPHAPTYVISSHYDSRDGDGYDGRGDAPGADDNGSGVSAVLEAARVMTRSHFRATIVFACFDGEEQGLFGSDHVARRLHDEGVTVGGDFNNDIIGASVGHDGERTPFEVRLFSEALAANADVRRVDALGSENDSPARELARFTKETAQAYVPEMYVALISRSDRFLRGGDQQSFAARGAPAIRFVEAHENFDHQHQNVRVENGVQYGDLLDYVDDDYLARVTRLNVAALATIGRAPQPPLATMDVHALAYGTTLAWTADPAATSYDVVWRGTTDPTWTHERRVGNVTTATLPLSKDDWIFGVRAFDAQGHASVASYPAPVR